jgi:signal transduction histidine kinase/ligand-binding sensor domain-containing protein
VFCPLCFKLLRDLSIKGLIAIILICIAGSSQAQAQSQNLRFDYLTPKDGLSSNRIWFIHRDSKEFLWIGTDVGVDRYDSRQVHKYRYGENRPGSISSNNTRSVYEDKDKNLWIATSDGLNLYDRSKDNFVIYKHNPADTNSLNSNSINNLIEDNNGNLWVVTDGNCLNRLIHGTNKFIRYHFENNSKDLFVRPVRMIAKDSKGYFWIADFNHGLHGFDPENGKFTKFEDQSIDFGSSCLRSLYVDNDDKVWIATDGSGFFSYDPSTSRFEQFGSKGDGKGTNQNRILDIIPEDENHLLLAVDQGGINRFDKRSRTFEYLMYDEKNTAGLNNNGIWCFHRDSEGILWIGTSGGGINYYNPKKDNFKLFRHNSSNPKSLSNNITLCFYEDHEGLIWIGTDGGGLNRYNPATGEFTVFKHNDSDPFSISGNIVSCLTEDSNHDIWIGTWDAELNRFDRKTGRFYHYTPEKNNASSVSGRTVWNILRDHNSLIWLGVFQVGIDILDINKGVIEKFRTDVNNPAALSNSVLRIFYEDSEKNMWITTAQGLNFYDRKNNAFKVINFPDNDIEAFLRDSEGNLWVGSHASGIYYCKPDGTLIKRYTTDDGLTGNSIRTIVEDNSGIFWISTSSGISRFDRKTGELRNYSERDGLQGDEFLRQSFLKTRKGEIFFGGYNGFNSFFPDSLKNNDFIPPVYISDFQIFNKPVKFGSPEDAFSTHISETREIKLTWKQSVFSFSFNAVNYTFPEKNLYAYIMDGFETDWNYTDASRRYVTYTNLDQGEYTFKVRASNNDGIWNEQEVSLKVIILPPWWSTWWFRIILFSSLILIFISISFSRVINLKKQKLLLEKTVALKTTELHELNASKDKFFSIIAHDLKNPFNTIIGFSDILKGQLSARDYENSEKYAAMINVSAVQTLMLLENLLAWANSQRGKIVYTPKQLNMSDLIQEEVFAMKDLASSKNINILTSFFGDLLITVDRNMIKTIVRNLITNAIKFTPRNGIVKVNAMQAEKSVEISVSDSGVGMTSYTISKLFKIDGNLSTPGTEMEKGTGLGLVLCKEFVNKHNGKIWVESEPGHGTIVKVLLPSENNT